MANIQQAIQWVKEGKTVTNPLAPKRHLACSKDSIYWVSDLYPHDLPSGILPDAVLSEDYEVAESIFTLLTL